MGARLVAQVLTRWTHVSDRAFRVLTRMALTALDEPTANAPAATYFGGRDLLAMTLRNERGGDQQTKYRTVKRALSELAAEGAIERTADGRAGQNAVYLLTLDNRRPVSHDRDPANPSQGDTSGPPQGDTSGPPQGDTSSPARGTPADPPRKEEEGLEELLEEPKKRYLRTELAVPRARGREDQISPHNERRSNMLAPSDGTASPAATLQALLTPPPEPARRPCPTGLGICVPCWEQNGAFVVAADETGGSFCAHHTREQARA